MSDASQELRDARAAMSIVQSPLDPYQQIVDLYPETANMTKTERQKRREQTTESDRVKAIMQNDVFKLEAERDAILGHMVEVALDRNDRDNAIRAASLLAKIGGWYAPTKIDATAKNFNIHSMLSNPAAIQEALALMSHEPGEAVAVESDARSDYERRRGKPVDAHASEPEDDD